MPILSALTSALPYLSAAWQVGSQYLTKPKKADYVPTGSMYQRYLAHLKSKTSESTVFHQRMRPALRQIGQQTQRGQRQVGQFVSRNKPGGGVEAQMRMGINQQALEAIGIASEKASVAQEQVNERTGEQLLRIGVQEERQLQQYQRAKRDFTKRMFATTAQAGISLASISAKNTAAREKAIGKTIADAEATQAKSDEAIKTDYNSLPESFRQETSFDDYLQDVRAMSTEITTKLVEPTKDDINAKKERIDVLKGVRDSYEKGTEDWITVNLEMNIEKGNLETAKQKYKTDKKTYNEDLDKYVTVDKESTGGLAPFAGTGQQISAAYVNLLKEQAKEDEKFQEDIELENITRQSADELIRIKQYTDENPEDALAFIRESKTLQRSMTTKDYIAAGKYAAGKATQLYPFENEFTSAVLRDSLKDMKIFSGKIYESKATNKVKLSVHRTVQAAKAERIADLEREIRTADKEKVAALKLEVKGLKFDGEKDSLSLLLGVEAELHTTYREGENEQGKLYSDIGKDSISGVQATLKAISFNKETGAGMSKSQSVGLKKGIIRWAKAIEFDDAQISDLFRNMSKLAEGIPEIQNYINTNTTSAIDSRSLTLIKYYLNRIDSLYKQIPYDDTEDLVQGTFAE